MERVKRRKLKFPCLFGGTKEIPRCKTIQSLTFDNATTEQSLFQSEVGNNTSKGISNEISVTKPSPSTFSVKTVESGDVSLSEYGYFGDEILTGYRSKSMPCRINFHENDRLLHSLSNISERSLINEESNRMSERWKMTRKQDDVETLRKCTTLGEILSFHDKETRLDHDADETEMVYNEPMNQGRRLGQKDMLSINVRYYKSCVEDGGFFKHQPSISDTDYSGNKIETSSETSNKSAGDANFQLSGPESEDCESLKDDDQSSRFSLLEGPSDDELSDSDCFQRLNHQIQELKKQLHLLKVESTITSNDLTPPPKVKHLGQHTSISILESDTSNIYEIDLDTFTPPYQTIHHPKDPTLFFRLQQYYFNEEIIPRPEKLLFHDYIQQTFIRISRSMVTFSWVSPEKRESQLTLTKLSLGDQIRKITDEMEKENGENFLAINYDKDPEWTLPIKEIDILGNLLAELVLHDLVLEVTVLERNCGDRISKPSKSVL